MRNSRAPRLRHLPAALAVCVSVWAFAQEPQISATELALQGRAAAQTKDYARAAERYRRAVALGVKNPRHAFDGARFCLLAGDREGAFLLLRKAIGLGFRDAGDLRGSADLAPLRDDPRWVDLVAGAAANEARFLARHSDPEGAAFVTSDVERFWTVYSKLPAAADPVGLLAHDYLDAGSVGLQDFIPNRILGAANLHAVLQRYPKYFASIREHTLKVAGAEPAVRQAFRRFKALYAEATFPDVYFVMGALNSGGTSSSNGLLIGADLFGRGPGVPLDEMDDWHRTAIHAHTDLPSIIAHELIHFQQRHDPRTLLGKAFNEGSADFLASLISEGNFNQATYDYGYAHEAELWKQFRAEMGGEDTSRWLYGSSRRDGHPADLGYFMGFRIAQAYYHRAKDKGQAVRDILTSGDIEGILKASQYGEGLR